MSYLGLLIMARHGCPGPLPHGDEEPQFARARCILRREVERGKPVFVSQLVLLESERVLRSRYELSKIEIVGAFSGLLESAELHIERAIGRPGLKSGAAQATARCRSR